jgi:integrase
LRTDTATGAFPTLTDRRARDDFYRACRDAGVAAYSPHDLRHRRCSLWYADIRDAVGLIRWSGHSKPSMFLDVYSHVLLGAVDDEWQVFWREAYAAERSPGVVPVVSQAAQNGLKPASSLDVSLPN